MRSKPKPKPPAEPEAPVLTEVHTRFFADDVATVKAVAAEKGLPWQIELRLLVRRALKGERREVVVLSEKP